MRNLGKVEERMMNLIHEVGKWLSKSGSQEHSLG